MFTTSDAIIECVPNFSEGRNQSIIDAIANAISSIKEVKLLHVDIGEDANRTVYTFAGKSEAVIEAAYQAIKIAQEKIDMRMHQGAHPRMGACDVCPLIPLQNISMHEVKMYATKLGQRLGDLGIPVYLYEQSATIPYRKRLENIRKGEYEAIPEKLKNINWKPDFGTTNFNEKFGMMALGARNFLIAYNINLKTENLEIAKQIAHNIRAIRKQNNGSYLSNLFQHVKAIGWYMPQYHCTQISTNIVNIDASPIIEVFDAIKQISADFGIDTNGSELIGLIPQRAFKHATLNLDDAIEYLGLNVVKPFDKHKNIIEYRLFS
ncbi:MAG: glutamate formimidoyltransferase [Chitinophagales bacterium]